MNATPAPLNLQLSRFKGKLWVTGEPLTIVQVTSLLLMEGGPLKLVQCACWLCLTPFDFSRSASVTYFNLDHAHERREKKVWYGRVRGPLCGGCNKTGLPWAERMELLGFGQIDRVKAYLAHAEWAWKFGEWPR